LAGKVQLYPADAVHGSLMQVRHHTREKRGAAKMFFVLVLFGTMTSTHPIANKDGQTHNASVRFPGTICRALKLQGLQIVAPRP